MISPKAADIAPVIEVKSVFVEKVPSPLPKSKLALAELLFAVMISSLPSPLISPKVTENGVFPVANSVLAPKLPLPLPNSTLTFAEP